MPPARKKTASPGTTLRRFGLHLKIYFQGFPRSYTAHFLREHRGCRLAAWTDADIDAYGARIKVSPERIRREDWVGQARAEIES